MRLRVTAALLAAGLLSGCSGGGLGSAGSALGNLVAFNSTRAPAAGAAAPEADPNVDLVCPEVHVREGAAALRVMAGGAVRHQFSIGELARQCRVVNKQLILKVGVEGKALLGPAGSPSSFSVPITIAVRRDGEERALVSRAYRAQAVIPAGQSQTTFTVVSDEIAVPFISESANEDYEILVSVDGAAPAGEPRRRR
ncbi:MAG: hypothetical protein ACO27F_14330 [Beijerinckiaceae bacterium]|jgi:hypothetical protein